MEKGKIEIDIQQGQSVDAATPTETTFFHRFKIGSSLVSVFFSFPPRSSQRTLNYASRLFSHPENSDGNFHPLSYRARWL